MTACASSSRVHRRCPDRSRGAPPRAAFARPVRPAALAWRQPAELRRAVGGGSGGLSAAVSSVGYVTVACREKHQAQEPCSLLIAPYVARCAWGSGERRRSTDTACARLWAELGANEAGPAAPFIPARTPGTRIGSVELVSQGSPRGCALLCCSAAVQIKHAAYLQTTAVT